MFLPPALNYPIYPQQMLVMLDLQKKPVIISAGSTLLNNGITVALTTKKIQGKTKLEWWFFPADEEEGTPGDLFRVTVGAPSDDWKTPVTPENMMIRKKEELLVIRGVLG